MIRTLLFCVLFCAISCSTESQKVYVSIDTPTALTNNEEAVELLNERVETINIVLNSVHDLLNSMEEIAQTIAVIDVDRPEDISDQDKAQLKKQANHFAKVQSKFALNLSYHMLKFSMGEMELENFEKKLTGSELAAFVKVRESLNLESENMKESLKAFEEKVKKIEPLFDKIKTVKK